jgi:tellurite resistance protein
MMAQPGVTACTPAADLEYEVHSERRHKSIQGASMLEKFSSFTQVVIQLFADHRKRLNSNEAQDR